MYKSIQTMHWETNALWQTKIKKTHQTQTETNNKREKNDNKFKMSEGIYLSKNCNLPLIEGNIQYL